MHTEEQAKELWCPHSRIAVDLNLGSAAHNEHHCIGSKCSQWRWGVKVVYPEPDPEPETNSSFWDIFSPPKIPVYGPMPEITQSDKGYCGLAGKP